MSKRDHILVGLDIGTTKICAIVAEVPEEGPLNIIGVGATFVVRCVVTDSMRPEGAMAMSVHQIGCEIDALLGAASNCVV